MADPLLSVADLTVERGGRIVLSKLSFALAAGEAILVSGRNGAGKSTLLRTLAGLLAAQSGHIGYALADDEVRGVETVHYLGYEDALKPSLTVGENLEFWAAMLSTASSAPKRTNASRGTTEGSFAHPPVRDNATPPAAPPHPGFINEHLAPREALEAYGIARLIELPAAYLSAGQKRRVALARLLLAHRPIWLLDEPLIALDKGAQSILTSLMRDHLEGGGAILVASHQPLALPYRRIDLSSRETS